MENVWEQRSQIRYLESSEYRGMLELMQEDGKWSLKAIRKSCRISLYAFSEFAYYLLNGKCEFLKNEEIEEIKLLVYARSGKMLARKQFVKGDTFENILQTFAEEIRLQASYKIEEEAPALRTQKDKAGYWKVFPNNATIYETLKFIEDTFQKEQGVDEIHLHCYDYDGGCCIQIRKSETFQEYLYAVSKRLSVNEFYDETY